MQHLRDNKLLFLRNIKQKINVHLEFGYILLWKSQNFILPSKHISVGMNFILFLFPIFTLLSLFYFRILFDRSKMWFSKYKFFFLHHHQFVYKLFTFYFTNAPFLIYIECIFNKIKMRQIPFILEWKETSILNCTIMKYW